MFEIISSNQRGRADFGWLQSQHSFSFGEYYNPARMGFSALRVINDDEVAPGAGFHTHSHRNMEIISYVLEGTMAHRDSAGHQQVLPAGEFQLMSAGRGISHSEFNASQTERLKFLQIWLKPAETETAPSYQQKAFGQQSGLTEVITPDGRNGTLQLRQNARLSQLLLATSESEPLTLAAERSYYLHVIAGDLQLSLPDGNQLLQAGDGIYLSAVDATVAAQASGTAVRALWFDLPAA